MALAAKVLRLKVCFALACLLVTGCTSGSGLLEPQSNSGLLTANQLAMPPEDALAVATPSLAQNEEIEVAEGVPTLTELNSFVQPGIDPAREAKELEQGIQTAAVAPNVKWRGKYSQDGIDVANISGVLCSSPAPARAKNFTIQLACSDGRMATLRGNTVESEAKILFGTAEEKVLLEAVKN